MSMFDGPYLRILTPQTIDGTNVMLRNEKVVYKETHLPLSAKKVMERKNAKLPPHLRHKIEVVGE